MIKISSEEIIQKALDLGWDDAGIAPAEIPAEDIQSYQQWLADQFHGDLAYMENQIRCKPQELLPGAKSAIIFITNYRQDPQPFIQGTGLVASYARGRDYHHLHRKRLKKFISWLETKTNQTGIAKGFSDSTPILEKALAVRAGLGWFGKNTLLIHRRFGTFTLLSGILTTLELEFPPIKPMHLPRCGVCTRCLDACPTQALVAPYKLDARLCLSYHLIESKAPIPDKIKEQNPGYIFGCDICQEACPHNQRKKNSNSADFSPERGAGIYLALNEIEKFIDQPETLYGTPLQRKGPLGLQSNWLTLKN